MNHSPPASSANGTSKHRVLITGATGFIGRNCVRELLHCGGEVCAVSRNPGIGKHPNLHERCCDLFKAGEASAVMDEFRPSHLLHLAWTMPSDWTSTEDQGNSAWIEASMNLLKSFTQAGGRRVVLAGTCAEYDWKDGKCVEDKTPIKPRGAYAACKAELHHRSMHYCRGNGVSHVWARVFFAYGPHESRRRLVPSVVCSLLRGETAKVSHGAQMRDYVYVGDVADAMVRLLASDVEGAFNIGSGEAVRLRDLVSHVGMALDRLEAIEFGAVPAQQIDHPIIESDTHKLSEATGWKAKHDLTHGLNRTIAWWKRALAKDGVPAGKHSLMSLVTQWCSEFQSEILVATHAL